MELTKYIKDKNLLLLFILFIATLILHVYALDTLNPYLQIDEAAIGYSSWCLGEYGTDRYLNSYPIYIKNFYGGQSIAYAWLIVPFIKLFGLNLFSIRLPMAIMYSIAIFPLYHLLKDEEKNLGIVACSLYTFSSIIILAGRTALDCYLMLPVTIFLFDQIYSAIKTQKTIHFVLSAILSGLILYTYALSYLIMPIFLLIVFALAIKYKKISIKQSVIFICILLTISIPIFLQVITILVIKEPWKIGPFTFITMPRDVTSELSKHSWKNVVNYVMSSLITDSLRFDGLVGEPVKFGVFGGAVPFGKIISNYGILSIPFFVYGLYKTIRRAVNKKNKISLELLLLIYLAIITVLYSSMYMIVYRVNTLLPIVIIIIAIGITEFCRTLKRKRIVFGIYLADILLILFIIFPIKLEQQIRKTNYSGSIIPYTEELEFINNDNELNKKDINILSPQPSLVNLYFTLQIDPKIIKDIDDTIKGKEPYIYGKYNLLPNTYEPNDIFIVPKDYIDKFYKPLLNDIESMNNMVEFKYYKVYYN